MEEKSSERFSGGILSGVTVHTNSEFPDLVITVQLLSMS
jgi:hypothetical protein